MIFLMLSLLPVLKSPCSLAAFVGSRINLDIEVRARYKWWVINTSCE